MILSPLLAALLLLLALNLANDPESRQATGVKVGEVTPHSAIAWMRVTEQSSRNPEGTPPGRPPRRTDSDR